MLLPIGNDTVRYRTPWVTYWLIGVNILVYVRMLFLDEVGEVELLMNWASLAAEWSPIRSVTAGFLHADILHLAGNMWFLFLFGSSVEGKLGHLQMGATYLAGLLVPDLAQHFLAPGGFKFVIGTDGAVGTIVGMYWFLFSRAQVQFFYWIFTFWVGNFWTSIHWAVIYLFGWDVLMWFLQSQYGFVSNSAYGAHLGGLACGFLFGLLLRQFSYVTLDGDDMLTRVVVWNMRRRAPTVPPQDPRFGLQEPAAHNLVTHQPPEPPKKSEGPLTLPLD